MLRLDDTSDCLLRFFEKWAAPTIVLLCNYLIYAAVDFDVAPYDYIAFLAYAFC